MDLQSELTSPRFASKRHRVRAVPAIAGLHALPALETHHLAFIQDQIRTVHAKALDLAHEPNRDVLQMFWQNAIAALIRNQNNWLHFLLDPSNMDQASELCVRYLRDDDEMLFGPALYAFQFLLTYRHSLREREETDPLHYVERLLQHAREFNHRRGYYWFASLENLYGSLYNFETILP